jgi:hypothetical protein
MGTRLARLEAGDGVIMYDPVTDWAFGPIMSTWHEATNFLQFLARDPRTMRDQELSQAYRDFLVFYGDPDEEPYNEDDREEDRREGIGRDNGY